MRSPLALVLLTVPAQAWEAGTDGRLCTLDHAQPEAEVRLTYDPVGPVYTITVTTPAPWPIAPLFSIRFEGNRTLTISTDRHTMDETGRALTVTDSGFGNVLDGLEFNRTATAFTGDAAAVLDLEGAAPEVQRFRDCTVAPAV
jgi:hypothetical protein